MGMEMGIGRGLRMGVMWIEKGGDVCTFRSGMSRDSTIRSVGVCWALKRSGRGASYYVVLGHLHYLGWTMAGR